MKKQLHSHELSEVNQTQKPEITDKSVWSCSSSVMHNKLLTTPSAPASKAFLHGDVFKTLQSEDKCKIN